MKLNSLVVALLLAAFVWIGLPRLSWGEREGYEVIVTAYTCEATPRNPMYPCGRLRWGGDINSPGMACPYDWRNRVMEVPGYGIRRCDDTPAQDFMSGLPHIDLRVPTVAEARRIGVRRMTIYPSEPAPAAPPAPAATSREGAIQLAQKQAPQGDGSTALTRLLRFDRVQEHFPTLVEGITLPGDQPVWVVTLWVPSEAIPGGSTAKPNPDTPIAAQFFLLNAKSGDVLTSAYIANDTLDVVGWVAEDSTALD